MHNDPLAESLAMGNYAADMESDVKESARSIADHVTEYARENPCTVALCCFALGFFVGWKLKPW